MMRICNISFNLPFMRLFYVLSLGLLLVFFAIHPNDLKADTNFCQDQDSVDVLFCKDFQSHSTAIKLLNLFISKLTNFGKMLLFKEKYNFYI